MRLIAGLFRLMFRLILLPFKILFATIGGTFRVGYKVGTTPVRVGFRATRVAGFSGIVCFFLGLAVGLLFAPAKGRDLRAKLQRALGRGAALSDDELAEKVGFELGHAPRTWHLPQPDVSVTEGRVQLRGNVPHDTAREELVRVAATIQGVSGVDDLLEVEVAAAD
jgi:BON domain